ncbi:MAG: RNA 2',3'-cyclic phosphodiesterase [Nanoarchaeota archaeon]|nr:RNA 2',3'-cyclic phosphodiesterase [Nanoarchaeota archaeon]MBU4452062.1 RNA 2',3'-cyclic phosphodiesterase [Nanoarchaeota archaeon]MCG2724443.1 RNA 2',3'-cyclic phosphodiesterase [archaeon]
MRCFIEIDVPDINKSYILENMMRIKNTSTGYDFRITKKENLHITLAFLGEINEKTLSEIIKKVSEIAKSFCSFECIFSKIEPIPAKFPRIIWITLDENITLSKLYEELKKALMLENEHGSFKAHITAARLNPDSKGKKIININKKGIEPLKFRVSELKIMKSILKSDGPEYIVIESIHLAKNVNLRE